MVIVQCSSVDFLEVSHVQHRFAQANGEFNYRVARFMQYYYYPLNMLNNPHIYFIVKVTIVYYSIL